MAQLNNLGGRTLGDVGSGDTLADLGEPGAQSLFFNPLRFGPSAVVDALRALVATPEVALRGAAELNTLPAAQLSLAPRQSIEPILGAASMVTGGRLPFAGPGELGVGGGKLVPKREAPFPQYAEEYPAIGPPSVEAKTTKGAAPGETYLAKQLTPEAEAFMKARGKIMTQMEKEGYEPYFDPAQRSYVDPSKYPPANVDTLTIMPKKPETVQKYLDYIGAPETMQRLRDALARGEELGNADHWYAMGQLERAYIKELGAKQGRAAFLDEFATPMAATTSGNDPTANLLMAHFLERQRKLGLPTQIETYNMPATVGGRRPAMNVRDYNAMRERGGYAGLGEDQPKMHNFARSFIGDLSRAVMDEQMASGMLAGAPDKIVDQARKAAFGMLEQPVHALAAERGVAPGNVQDVAWAGFKNEPGKPMISIINDAIERTSRLTGMSPAEIVRRGLIRKEIPIYGAAGAIGTKALGDLGD